jgi:hypothetical protein
MRALHLAPVLAVLACGQVAPPVLTADAQPDAVPDVLVDDVTLDSAIATSDTAVETAPDAPSEAAADAGPRPDVAPDADAEGVDAYCCGGPCPLVDGYQSYCNHGLCVLWDAGNCAVDTDCADGGSCVGVYRCCGPNCSSQLGTCM